MKKILLGITGSIAAYKSCELISLLKKKGYRVQCVLSRTAKKFITPLTLETLSNEKVLKNMFELPEERIPEHVSASDDADVILIAPATADVIAKIAAGICDCMLTTVVCAASCPVVIAPAMNDKMYNNPILREKIEYLKKKNYIFIEPVEGHLACNREGMGHLAEVAAIAEKTEKILEK